MSIKAIARHDRVVLKALENEEEMYGRIVKSDNGKEKANRYQIVAIGPGLINPVTGFFTPTQYSVGEEVYVHKALVHNVDIGGEEFFVTRDMEILIGYKKEEIND